jgi:hypothetical protein
MDLRGQRLAACCCLRSLLAGSLVRLVSLRILLEPPLPQCRGLCHIQCK